MTAPLSKDLVGLAAILGISGCIHLGKPEVYEPIMPKLVPAHREVIFASGAAEILCAVGLLVPRLRRPSGWASAAQRVRWQGGGGSRGGATATDENAASVRDEWGAACSPWT